MTGADRDLLGVEQARPRKWPRGLGISALVLVLLLVVVPLLWPVPELKGTVAPEQLADEDSLFINVDGIPVHYKESGSALAPQTVILLHGFGASTFSYRDQMELLGDRAHVIAFDRPGFGLTGRPLPGDWTGPGPYGPEANADRVIGLMDVMDIDKAVIVGHSAGGAVAALAAAKYPHRFEGLVLEAPALYESPGAPTLLRPLLGSPQARRLGPLLARRMVASRGDAFITGAYHDPSLVTSEVLAGYRRPLAARDWDKALWELLIAPAAGQPSDALGQIEVPTLVIAGTEDAYVPYADSVRASREVSGAVLARIPDTGHIPHEENPAQFANEVFRFLDTLPGCASG